jgi:hypothetical protein
MGEVQKVYKVYFPVSQGLVDLREMSNLVW